GSAPAYLPLASGYVAMTIPTGEQQGVAGHITLGDYITVIASASLTVFSTTGAAAGPAKVVSKTVFTNVHIIGLGPASANVQPAGSAGAAGGAPGATPRTTSSPAPQVTRSRRQPTGRPRQRPLPLMRRPLPSRSHGRRPRRWRRDPRCPAWPRGPPSPPAAR